METSFRKIQQPLCASFTNCKTSFRKIQQPVCVLVLLTVTVTIELRFKQFK